jgi:uncharacterized protein with PQ loop repeat
MNKISHKRIFFHAVRSALLFIAVFFIYDILINLEKLWNEENPDQIKYNYYLHKIIKFNVILIIDLFILYFASIFFNIEF